jgi:hypothetical protein
MSERYPARPYRRPSKQSLRQGDISITEFHQIRARSGDRRGPAGSDHAAPQLPFLGDPTDFEVNVPQADGSDEMRIVRIWSGFVMVLHQNCEIEFAHPEDSRVLIAPIVPSDRWPEASWKYLRENVIPGYFYLPGLTDAEAKKLGLPRSWPEAVVALASSTLSSVGLIKPRRQLSLAPGMLPYLHDSIARFFAVRGFAGMRELGGVVGKRIVSVEDANQTVPGPSRLVKVYFGENPTEADERDDELTVAYWGVRP